MMDEKSKICRDHLDNIKTAESTSVSAVASNDVVMGAVFAVAKSQKQKQLEAQGCVFKGQELLDNHEIDPMKECYCGRPRRILDKPL